MRGMKLAALGLFLLGFTSQYCLAAEPLTLDQLVQKHLAAIGTQEARAAAKNRLAQGTSRWEIITGGAGTVEGTATLVCDSQKTREVLKLNTNNYRGEDLLTDGDKIQVSKSWQVAGGEPKRSLIGDFLYNEPALLRDGLLTGTLGTAWPLLDPKFGSAKLSYEGLKTIEGRQVHEVKFVPKKKGDADIKLYFDQDFRHVMTITTMTLDPRLKASGAGPAGDFMGRGMTGDGGRLAENARQQPVRYRFVQTFDGFQQVDGLTLPTESDLKFSAEGYASQTVRYTAKFETIQHNVPMDARNFQMK